MAESRLAEIRSRLRADMGDGSFEWMPPHVLTADVNHLLAITDAASALLTAIDSAGSWGPVLSGLEAWDAGDPSFCPDGGSHLVYKALTALMELTGWTPP